MEEPRVSVLLPYHNAAGTIGAAIESMVDQSFHDIELLLIDNASTDESSSIVREWMKKDQRIRAIKEPRIGIAFALNKGLLHANADLIARMDADDISFPDRIGKQVAFMDGNSDIGVVGTRTEFRSTVKKNSGMRWFVEWQNRIITPDEHFVKRFVDAPLAHPTVMFRKSLIEKFGGYATDPVPEDHELWLRWMDAGVHFAKVPEDLLIWNDHNDRLSRNHSNYSVHSFYRTKVKWLAKSLRQIIGDRFLIIAGTSRMCRERAALLETEGLRIEAFTDVRFREMPCYRFIAHDQLPPKGEAFIVSFISQRGTGDRIAAYFTSIGLTEGEDFILAA